MKKNLIIIPFFFFLFGSLSSESVQTKESNEFESSTTLLSIQELVEKSFNNNVKVKSILFEIATHDSLELKNDSKYAWKAISEMTSEEKKQPFNQANIFTGSKISSTIYEVGVEKYFSTGTYFKVASSTKRFDSNAFEDASTTPTGFSALGVPPLYTGLLGITFSQELLRNAFGYQERNVQKILKREAQNKKDELYYKLSEEIIQTFLDYWDYVIKENSYETINQLYKNTEKIKKITQSKTNSGLSEQYEINQWNALLLQAENQVHNAIVARNEAKRKINRKLGMQEDDSLQLKADFYTIADLSVDYQKDLEYAYSHRADVKSLKNKKEIVSMINSNAKLNYLPKLTVNGKINSQAQNFRSPTENFSDTNNNNVFSAKYKETMGQVKINLPLFDKATKADYRDSEILKKQIELEETDLLKFVKDDVLTRIEALEMSKKILDNSITAEKESELYYKGIVRSFSNGRTNAVSVKNALDNLVQDQLSLIQAKVNLNINQVRYYLVKNQLFEVLKLDLDPHRPKF